jgi:hypothetical protein
LIEPSQLSRWIYENEDIWQLDFLDPNKLTTFDRDRKVDFWEGYIIQLWQLGWVRAEIVRGTLASPIEGIDILEKQDAEKSLYADNRNLGIVGSVAYFV